MQLETLSCNSCGGPLEVPETVNYVTCTHCSSRLVIKRNSSATFTEQLDALEAQQDVVLEKLSRIERENRLVGLDRNWERDKQRYMIADKHGHKHEPSTLGVVGPLIAAACGIAFIFLASPAFGHMMPFGLIFVAIGVVIAIINRAKHRDFLAARRRYRKHRTAVFRNPSPDNEWSQLDQVPTPEQYLQRLENE
ncbi:MAG: hypothetical protein ABGZ17_18560 [Planctomycetaceae bacterium]